jgi:hypothetical protein
MSKTYYREKLMKLVEKLFTHQGDAKSKFIEFENLIDNAYISSKSGGVEKAIVDKWDVIWNELNVKPELNLGNRVFSSFFNTVKSKRNKSLVKYLDFFLEEFYRVI